MQCAASTVVLKAEKISKRYKMGAIDVHALREVDMELKQSECIRGR